MNDVSAVIVLHNSAEAIADCLRSIPDEAEVIAVDNASADGGGKLVSELRPSAVVVTSERNIGFGGGCNLGRHAATRPYVLFLNPDARLTPGALEILLEALQLRRGCVVGPALRDADGAPRPVKRRPSSLLDFCGLLPAAARWAPTGWDGKLPLEDPVHRDGGAVACVEGACFLVASDVLEAIGGFDEDFFLYYEEESIALRLRRHGGRMLYEPRAVVEHAGGSSTGKVSALATRHFHRSRVIFYRKRDGELRGRLTALLLMLAAVIGLLTSLVNVALGRHRQTDPGYWSQVLGGLGAGAVAKLSSPVG